MALPAAAFFVGGMSALSKRIQTSALAAAIVTGITYMYKTKLGLFIMGAMVWLGINFGTIALVIEPAIDLMYGYAQGGAGGGEYAAAAMKWMGVMNLDRAITMVGSAVVAKNAILQGRLFLFKRGFGAP